MKRKGLKAYQSKFLSFMLMLAMLSSNVLPALAQTTSIGTININPSIDLRIENNSPRIVVGNSAVQQYTDYSRLRYKLYLTDNSSDVYDSQELSPSGMNEMTNDISTYTYDGSASGRAHQFYMRYNFGNVEFSKQLMCTDKTQYLAARLGLLNKETPRSIVRVSQRVNATIPAFSSSSSMERKAFCERFDITPDAPTTQTQNDPCSSVVMYNPDCYTGDQTQGDNPDQNQNQTDGGTNYVNPNLGDVNLIDPALRDIKIPATRVKFSNEKLEFTSVDNGIFKLTANFEPVDGDYVDYDSVVVNYGFDRNGYYASSNMRSGDTQVSKSRLYSYKNPRTNRLGSSSISINTDFTKLDGFMPELYCNDLELENLQVRFALQKGDKFMGEIGVADVAVPYPAQRFGSAVCEEDDTNIDRPVPYVDMPVDLQNVYDLSRKYGVNPTLPTEADLDDDSSKKRYRDSLIDLIKRRRPSISVGKRTKDTTDDISESDYALPVLNPSLIDALKDRGVRVVVQKEFPGKDMDLDDNQKDDQNKGKNYLPGLNLTVDTKIDFKDALRKVKKERDSKKRKKYRDELIDRLIDMDLPDYNYTLGDLDLTRTEKADIERKRKLEKARKDREEKQREGRDDKVNLKDYMLPTPEFNFTPSGDVKVSLYAPKLNDFDNYVVNLSSDKEVAYDNESKDAKDFKNEGSKKQINTLSPDKDLVCKDYPTMLYGSASVEKDGKVVKESLSKLAAVRIPALSEKSSDSRKKLCDYKAPTQVTDQVEETSSEDTDNRYAPEAELTKKVKVRFDIDAKRKITGKDASVLRPALNWAFDMTKDLVALIPNVDKEKQEDLYDKTKEARDDLVDKIQNAYPDQWPGFKKIFVDLRQAVDVSVDVTPDTAGGTDLDEAGNGIFDVSFDYSLLLRLAKKVNWSEIPTYTPEVIAEVEAQEEDQAAEVEQEAEEPVETLTTIADTDLPEEVEESLPEDETEVIYDEEEVPTEQEELIDDIQAETDQVLTDDLNNLWDYNYEYEVPEFDFTVCQRSYNPVVDGTFNDLPYDANDIDSLAAHCLKANNIIGGYSDGTFRTDQQVNRAEAAKFLMVSKFFSIEEVFNEFAMESFVERFPDVPAGQWYTEFVTVANRTGVINGYQDGTYKPGNTVSTGEFFKMLLSANPTGLSSSQIEFLKSQEQTIVPTDGSVWGPEFFYVVQKFNLLESRSGSQTSVDFNAPMTRGEVSVAIFKYLRDVTPDSDIFN